MENQIVKVFENEEFGKVNILIENGEPLFELYSVGMALGYVTTNCKGLYYPRKDRIDNIVENAGIKACFHNGNKYLKESMLYDFIFESKTGNAKELRKWVTETVLPSIRKTGGYVANEDLFIATYLPNVDENTKTLFRLNLQTIRQLNEKIDEQQVTIETQNKKIEEDKPKVEFANHVADASDCIDISTLAKLAKKENIKIGRNRLFEWLRKNDYLMSKGRHKNEPYQKYIDNGWFVVTEYAYNTAYGQQIGTKTYVTGKGQMCIIERLRKAYQNTII